MIVHVHYLWPAIKIAFIKYSQFWREILIDIVMLELLIDLLLILIIYHLNVFIEICLLIFMRLFTVLKEVLINQ
jgi:hypothetical protein